MEYTSKRVHGNWEKMEVVIYTQTHKIVGNIHSTPGSRLVDFINSKASDLFMVVTDATVYELPDEKLIQVAEYFAINRGAIVMVFPKQPAAPIISDALSKDITP